MSLWALALLAGLSFAVGATAVAGARRTASSFERLRAQTLAYDNGVAIDAPGQIPGDGRGYDDATVMRIEHLPEVAAAGEIVSYVIALPNVDGELALNVAVDGVVGTQIERDRILRGRMPAADRDDEVAVNELTVERTGVDVGGNLVVETLTPDQRLRLFGGDVHALDHGFEGPRLQMHVVGVIRGVTDVLGGSGPTIVAGTHFDTTYRGRIAYSTRILLVRRARGVTAAQFHDAVDGAVTGARLGVFDATDEDKSARRTIHTLGVGLVVFAFVAGAVAMLALNQSVLRHVAGSNPAHAALVALGLTRGQRVRGAIATVAPAAVIATVIATVASYAASPLMPVGLARRAEPDPGRHMDWFVAGIAALGVVVVVLGEALVAALSATRPSHQQPALRRASVARVSRLNSMITATGGGPVTATGVRLALDRRPPALPVRSTVVGVGAALAVIVGALTFTASLDRLEHNPQRWGYGWDLLVDPGDGGQHQLVQTLAADRDVAGVGVFEANFTYMGRPATPTGVRAYGLGTTTGSIGYALLSGHQPVGADEVVIGPARARASHLAVGDVAGVATCPCSGDPATTKLTDVRVVGTALFPEDENGNFNTALGFSDVGFQRHVGKATTSQVAVKMAAGWSLRPFASELTKRYPGQVSQFVYPAPPGEVESLAGLRSFPRALAVLCALLAVAALANMLVATRQRRSRELATLRSLGFTPRQARGSVIWQSVFLTGVATSMGVVTGMVGGAAVWLATTNGIGVDTDALRPAGSITSSALVSLVVAVALGYLIGTRIARTSVATSLNAE